MLLFLYSMLIIATNLLLNEKDTREQRNAFYRKLFSICKKPKLPLQMVNSEDLPF